MMYPLAVVASIQLIAISAYIYNPSSNQRPGRVSLAWQPHRTEPAIALGRNEAFTGSRLFMSSDLDPPLPPPLTGSVIRLDEMTGLWVVFATGRSSRPADTIASSSFSNKEPLAKLPECVPNCPFCAGNEDKTPDPLLKIGKLRVVPNKYPAIDPMLPGRMPRKSVYKPDKVASLHHETPAVGFHEVIIESPLHNAHIATEPDITQARDLLLCFKERGRAHHKQAGRGIEHTVYFKNHGATAGASLTHPHAQIVSTPVVPVEAQRLQSLALEYFKNNRCSLYERVVEEELTLHCEDPANSRVVDVSDNFLAVVPYASPGPYVVTILPRFGTELLTEGVDCSEFTSTSDELLEECATILQSVLRRHHLALNEPCFNLVVQSAPVSDRGVQAVYKSSAFFRWHIRITPRLGAGAMAGFELGSGFFSNSHIPEVDAADLRAIQPFLVEDFCNNRTN